MFPIQSQIYPMLIAEVREAWPRVAQLLDELAQDTSIEARRVRLRHIGAVWYGQGGAAEVLTELGLALSDQMLIEPGIVLSEMLLAYGAAQEEDRTREWEAHLLRRVSELDGLHRIISDANSTLDLDTSLQKVVRTVAEVVRVEACSIYIYDKLRDELVLRVTHGTDTAGVGQVTTRLGVGVTGWAAQIGKVVAVRDTSQDDRYRGEHKLSSTPFRSILAVPIVLFMAEQFHFSSDKLQGVLTIQAATQREFTQEEISFVEVAAGELAFFIANAQLYQQIDERLHQKVRELQTLQTVSKLIAEQLDLRAVLNLIVAKAVELSRADRADIFQADESHHPRLVASYGGDGSDGVKMIIEQTIADARPLAVLNAYQDSRFPELARVAAQEGFHSIFAMPLTARGRTIGGICLYTREPRHFDYDQARLISIFADEVAIAIENARLFDESQRALAVKSALLQEMHHRVRNNLQTISALLAMQLRRLDPDSRGAKALRESAARIQSIAAVHNLLSREDVGVTTVEALVRQLIESAHISLIPPDVTVDCEITGEPVKVESRDATLLALILNELFANAISHGLAAEGGRLVIQTTYDGEHAVVDVRDDGPTHPPPPQSHPSSGLGLQIIETLVHDDLKGSFVLSRDGDWMNARIRFPRRIDDE